MSPSCSPGPQSLELVKKPSKNKQLVPCMVKSCISLPSLIPFALSPLLRILSPLLHPCLPFPRAGQKTCLGWDVEVDAAHSMQPCCGEAAVLWGFCSFLVSFTPDEMSESRQTHVTLHDIDPQALEQLVQYAYTAEIVVGEGNVQVNPKFPLLHKAVLCQICLLGAPLSLCSALPAVPVLAAGSCSESLAASLPRGGSSKQFPALFLSTCPSPGPGGCPRCSFP